MTRCIHLQFKRDMSLSNSPYAAQSSTWQSDWHSNDPKYNNYINETLACIHNKEFASYSEAAWVTKVFPNHVDGIF